MTAYYNEHDPKAAAWLRELITGGHIAPGIVDERSIEDVLPDELDGYTQCHFFAGIGGWSLALRLAGWPDDRPVWTGSCPCQPFSAAGQGKGVDDSRHLWPAFYWLIAQCGPPICFGEQVASKAGRLWLAGVSADLEALGYAVGAADLCAAGVGAPHIRQRLWWVADAGCDVRQPDSRPDTVSGAPRPLESEAQQQQRSGAGDSTGCTPCRLADPERGGRYGRTPHTRRRTVERTAAAGAGESGGVADTLRGGQQGQGRMARPGDTASSTDGQVDRTIDACGGGWHDSIWIPCADGKARRLEPGTEPLAHGISGRVGLLRGYGNAIVPQLAAEFVMATMEPNL